MESTIINYQTRLNLEKDKLDKVTKNYIKKSAAVASAVRNIDSLYAHKLAATKPQIMVYGIYNAGKSSIINELLGEDSAKVRDIPTTDKIDYYDWQGYRIADTPGVGAPIEHENVTQEHLKQADVVIFVMSTTGSHDRKDNYVRMKDIADAGKKIIIVLNDKGLPGNEEEQQLALTEIKKKVVQNMKDVGIDDVENKYCIVDFNAKRAKKGRLENKNALYEKSNIKELQRVILTELKSTNSYDIIRNTIYEIEQNLEQIIKAINLEDSNEDSQAVNDILNDLKQKKLAIRAEMKTFIDKKTDLLAKLLPDILWQNREDADACNKAYADEVNKLAQSVEKELNNHLADIQSDFIADLEKLTEILEKNKINVQPRSVTVPDTHVEAPDYYRGNNFANTLELCKELLEINKKSDPYDPRFPRIPPIVYGGSGNKLSEGINETAKTVLKNEIGNTAGQLLAKEVAKTALGKSFIAKGIGSILPGGQAPVVIITAIELLAKFLKGNDEERRQEILTQNEYERRKSEAEAQAKQDLVQKCQYLCAELGDEVYQGMNTNLINSIGMLDGSFREGLKKDYGDKKKLIEDIAALREISNEYNTLYFELGGQKN